MKYNILFGGRAGQGTNILTHMLAETLVEKGYYTFYYRDYQSLIRGGHSFDILTFSDKPVHSNESKYDIIVALDELTISKHKNDLKKNGIIISGKDVNMYFAGKIYGVLGFSFESLDKRLKLLGRYKQNIIDAKRGFVGAENHFKIKRVPNIKRKLSSGSVGLAEGAAKSGIDNYFAYPMTPATGALIELTKLQKKYRYKILELENEIAVANAGAGSAITGAKTMVGTSGGGFDLMTEALSMCGMAEIPLIFYLAQRAGPSSGVPTYTSQADLQMARHSGHGEFSRLVFAPGDPIETQELISQMFYLTQKFKIPGILISDKHLAESFFTDEKMPEITKSKKMIKFSRFNSYEKDPITGCATEDELIIKKNVDIRIKNGINLAKECEKFNGFKIYGKKRSKNCILFWGSTKGAILDAIYGLDVCAIQILYIEPFPKKIVEMLKEKKKIIIIENNSTGQLCEVIREKTGILIKNKILKYDARPFLYGELREKIIGKLKK